MVWSDAKLFCNTLALAGDAAIIVYRVIDHGVLSHRLRIAERDTGQTRADVLLPGDAIFNGLCIDRIGHIIVALQDGRVACFGGRQ